MCARIYNRAIKKNAKEMSDMNNQKYIKLNNGVEMPMAGIGTFLLTPDEAEDSGNQRPAVRLSSDRYGQCLCE